jgi:hypothetical protein
VFKQADMTLNTREDIPYRDDVTYFLQPWKFGYQGADRFAREVFTQIEPDAVVYADNTTVAPLLILQQTEQQGGDVMIVSGSVHSPAAPTLTPETLDRLLMDHPVYVVSDLPGYCPVFIREHYSLHRKGLLKQVGQRDALQQSARSVRMNDLLKHRP